MTENLISSVEAAAMLGIKPTSLRIWRMKGKGPRFYKLGDSPACRVMYRVSDIEAWLQGHKEE